MAITQSNVLEPSQDLNGVPEPGASGDGDVMALYSTGETRIPVNGGILFCRSVGSEIRIGPWLPNGESGCAACMGLWRKDTSGIDDDGALPPDGRHLCWRHTAAGLIEFALRDPKSLRLRSKILELETGMVRISSFLPHPHCPDCASQELSSSAVALDLVAGQPTVGGMLRTRSFDRSMLREALFDSRFGPVAHAYRDEESPLSLVTCETVVPGTTRREGGYGRSTRFTSSEIPAYLEGFERVLGGHRMPQTSTVIGSYTQLAADAIDPATLGGHAEDAMNDPRFRLHRYSPDLVTSWVWAWSTRQDRQVLIPEHVAYWHGGRGHPKFLYESSNGCAVGGTFEEAALYGLFEVIERDAFLLAWYSQTRLREIRLDTVPDVGHISDLITERGLTLTVLDMTSDFGVPTALSVITAPEALVNQGLAPALSLASGTHPDGRKAIGAAIEEALTNALMYPKWVSMRASVSVERCRPMLHDYALVETLEDHTGMHGLSEARALSEFLHQPSGQIDADQFAAPYVQPTELSAELAFRVKAVHDLGLDLLVVNQSAPFASSTLGISAAKVIVPGSIPMTFGHLNRRLEGLPRLASAATLLKGGVPWQHASRISPIPHPFP
ncbi:TOMM precursor leader peptide-binding protein [uncultured Arthrobacter sp.]|uniref:TOMM precursor leader peptide-binding protein n=1 Tax=uncultured Arthrobacter sp. TaxID=114050 RepID=UPI00261D0498|nr:TOMM precursor leader peptide-binding protein [uncultured Arthrobacter sp.]